MTERSAKEETTPGGRVLVVDDDALVGEALRRVLSQFEIVFAQSVSGALGRIQAGSRFDAVICDYSMPGMTGIQFLEELAKTDPQLAKGGILLTGYSSTPEVRDFVERTGTRCLGKPFDVNELRTAVGAASSSTRTARPSTGEPPAAARKASGA
jgi:CheY-like chemotaxis protein